MTETPTIYHTEVANLTAEQRIVEAAIKVFLLKGFDGARMQEIADAAQINKALVHYYFRSKEQLFAKIFEELTRDMHRSLKEVLQSDLTFLDKIRRLVKDEILYLQANPTLPMFVIRELSRDAERFQKMVSQSSMQNVFKVFAAQVHQAVRNSEIRAVDPMFVFLEVFALTRFPFVARPMVLAVSGYSDEEYQQVLIRWIEEATDVLVEHLRIR